MEEFVSHRIPPASIKRVVSKTWITSDEKSTPSRTLLMSSSPSSIYTELNFKALEVTAVDGERISASRVADLIRQVARRPTPPCRAYRALNERTRKSRYPEARLMRHTPGCHPFYVNRSKPAC